MSMRLVACGVLLAVLAGCAAGEQGSANAGSAGINVGTQATAGTGKPSSVFDYAFDESQHAPPRVPQPSGHATLNLDDCSCELHPHASPSVAPQTK